MIRAGITCCAGLGGWWLASQKWAWVILYVLGVTGFAGVTFIIRHISETRMWHARNTPQPGLGVREVLSHLPWQDQGAGVAAGHSGGHREDHSDGTGVFAGTQSGGQSPEWGVPVGVDGAPQSTQEPGNSELPVGERGELPWWDRGRFSGSAPRR